eukprot:1154842-Pelagomonas_calceolata.AAC.3
MRHHRDHEGGRACDGVDIMKGMAVTSYCMDLDWSFMDFYDCCWIVFGLEFMECYEVEGI